MKPGRGASTASNHWLEKAKRFCCGHQSNMAPPEFADGPVLIEGKGARVWDIDGNEYIDFTIASGPGILGYGQPDWLEAVTQQLRLLPYLTVSTFRSRVEIELAEAMIALVPGAEAVRFCLSGSEAVQLAIRLARAFTGKAYIVQFAGHYHGWLDNIYGGLMEPRPDRPLPVVSANSRISDKGVDSLAFQSSFVLPWNDIEALDSFLSEHASETALILMEPINCNGGCCMPLPGYLEKVRELADRYQVVLCFDEIITGFRVGLHSAQGLLGVVPDLATFGKALAGGLPLSAVTGKKAIMALLEKGLPGPGTFNGNPLATAGALATIRHLKKDNAAFYENLGRLQQRLTNGLKQIFARYSIPALIQGPPGVFSLRFVDRKIAHNAGEFADMDLNRFRRFYSALRGMGILIYHDGRWYLCGGHTEADIDQTLACVEQSMAQL